MQVRMARAVVLATLTMAAVVVGQDQPRRIGSIDFYGYLELDLDLIKSAIPVRVGDPYREAETIESIDKAVRFTLHSPPTDVHPVCCDAQGNYMIYIGLPGVSSKGTKRNPVPKSKIRFPASVTDLYEQTMTAITAAVLKGNTAEEYSQGFALSTSDPDLRVKQLAVHAYAIQHEKLIRAVLNSSRDARQRSVAAYMLGYARQSRQQIADLVRASNDTDDGVRNNATRALGALSESSPRVAAQIPAWPFIRMVSSPSWTDRNKAAWLLTSLTRSRDRRLLSELRNDAVLSLVEMGRWRNPGHASTARILLGRIAGIPEERLIQLVNSDNAEEIIKALWTPRRKNHHREL